MSSDKALRVQFVNASDFALWDAFVNRSASGSVYSTAAYLKVLSETTGAQFRILAVYQEGQIVGGVGLYERRCLLGSYVTSRLLLYYNGLVLPEDELGDSSAVSRNLAVTETLAEALVDLGYSRVILNNRRVRDLRPFLVKGWSVTPSYSYLVDLSNPEQLWQRIDKNLRRLIRRAEQAGLTLTDDGEFDSFFAMHTETHDRKNAPIYLPREEYRKFIFALRSAGLAKLYQARLPNGLAVASQLVLLGGHPTTHTVSAAACREQLALGTTPYLRWSVFKDLASSGFRANDLTDAALNSVTKFKSQLGGELQMNLVLRQPDKFNFVATEVLNRILNKAGKLIDVLRPTQAEKAFVR